MNRSAASPLTVAVIVASLGRPEALAELLLDLERQSRRPDRIILSLTDRADVPPETERYAGVELVFGPKGSCVQRNTALDRLADACDVVMFLDDDYVPSRFAVERAVRLIETHPDVTGACGHLLADGIHGPGLSVAEARGLLAHYDAETAQPAIPHHDLDGLYGCNMVFRAAQIAGVRFDERLPLYGWQEDIDFAARAARNGRLVKTFAFAGVHRGIKRGRSSGVRLGYSQVVNPVYLSRKGTMRPRYAAKIVLRNVIANHLRALRPEAWVDRAGRARGNWLGLIDLALGRIRPERIEHL